VFADAGVVLLVEIVVEKVVEKEADTRLDMVDNGMRHHNAEG